MKVYKFGGASIKDASSVKNLLKIIQKISPHQGLCIVVSAMGKTTNALETLLNHYWNQQKNENSLMQIYTFHQKIIEDLFPDEKENIYSLWEADFKALKDLVSKPLNNKEDKDFDPLYDAIVSMGEVFSARIVSYYLQKNTGKCTWVDARKIIRTDSEWREGNVDWKATEQQINTEVIPLLATGIVLTQGFTGGNEQGQSTTLGREGSDYSAAIMAYSLQAESLTIWKDVPGVLNADPKRVPDAQLYAQLSYAEAAEMSKYGATVIHPKTIAPLAEKNIPLYVKSFLYPSQTGTCIDNTKARKFLPTIIFKSNQMLVSVEVKPMKFLKESDLFVIFKVIDRLGLRVNMLYKSAREIQICFEARPLKFKALQRWAGDDFKIKVIENLEMLTIKNADETSIRRITFGREMVLQVRENKLYQALMR